MYEVSYMKMWEVQIFGEDNNKFYTWSNNDPVNLRQYLLPLGSESFDFLFATETNFVVVLYACETWFVILKEEHGPKIENWVLVRYLSSMELGGKSRNLHNDKPHDLYSSSDSVWMMKSKTSLGAGHRYALERSGINTGYCWGKLKVRDRLGSLGVDKRVILKWILKE